jgi:hypothetical protein
MHLVDLGAGPELSALSITGALRLSKDRCRRRLRRTSRHSLQRRRTSRGPPQPSMRHVEIVDRSRGLSSLLNRLSNGPDLTGFEPSLLKFHHPSQ